MNGTYTGIDKSDFKGTDWKIQKFSDMARYLLRIGRTILNAQDNKADSQEKESVDKLKQSDRKRAAVQASLKSGKKHIKVLLLVIFMMFFCFPNIVNPIRRQLLLPFKMAI